MAAALAEGGADLDSGAAGGVGIAAALAEGGADLDSGAAGGVGIAAALAGAFLLFNSSEKQSLE